MSVSKHIGVRLPRITDMAHALLSERIKPGDTVIDATAGNGHDTLFLAELVGDEGRVHAYDLQSQAISTTRERLMHGGLAHRVSLHHASHTEIEALTQTVHGVIFNLGYLPGSDKTIITQKESTIRAVQASLNLLNPGGIVLLVVYRAHNGGQEEAGGVEAFVRKLPIDNYLVLKYEYINHNNQPPYILAVEKK